MNEAAEAMQFERAAVYRDQLKSLRHIVERQKVISNAQNDQDVLAFARLHLGQSAGRGAHREGVGR